MNIGCRERHGIQHEESARQIEREVLAEAEVALSARVKTQNDYWATAASNSGGKSDDRPLSSAEKFVLEKRTLAEGTMLSDVQHHAGIGMREERDIKAALRAQRWQSSSSDPLPAGRSDGCWDAGCARASRGGSLDPGELDGLISANLGPLQDSDNTFWEDAAHSSSTNELSATCRDGAQVYGEQARRAHQKAQKVREVSYWEEAGVPAPPAAASHSRGACWPY